MAEQKKQVRKRKSLRQRKRERRRLCFLLAFWNLFAVIGVITMVRFMAGEIGGKEAFTGNVAGTLSAAGAEALDQTQYNFDPAKAEGGNAGGTGQTVDAAECRRIYENNKELLVLVNKSHALDASYDPKLRNICSGRLEASGRLYNDLSQMLRDADREGHSYWISSAYRSRKRQQELVDQYAADYRKKGMSEKEALQKTYELTMPAGKSEHQTGLALDILCSENTKMDESQAKEAGNQWLCTHCHEYGFILRYPKGKENLTQIDYEPWHFRYVGKEAALFMWENDLTLEEFYSFLGI